MFGKGIYFATDSSKSAQYTKSSDKLLLCNVAIGNYKTVNSADKNIAYETLISEGYDSVYAPRDTKTSGGVLYDEFVVYHPHQAIPKYVITFITEIMPQQSASIKAMTSKNNFPSKSNAKTPLPRFINKFDNQPTKTTNIHNPGVFKATIEEDLKNQGNYNGISLSPKEENNYHELIGFIQSHSDSVYNGQSFQINITVPNDYPSSIPQFKFQSSIVHPNVSDTGEVKITLGERRIIPLLQYIQNLLSNPDMDNIVFPHATSLWPTDKSQVRRTNY